MILMIQWIDGVAEKIHKKFVELNRKAVSDWRFDFWWVESLLHSKLIIIKCSIQVPKRDHSEHEHEQKHWSNKFFQFYYIQIFIIPSKNLERRTSDKIAYLNQWIIWQKWGKEIIFLFLWFENESEIYSYKCLIVASWKIQHWFNVIILITIKSDIILAVFIFSKKKAEENKTNHQKVPSTK